MRQNRPGSHRAAVLTFALTLSLAAGLTALWVGFPADARTDAAPGRAFSDALLGELEAELATTQRVLERVPEDRLTWKPHDTSRTLGSLARHVAEIPELVSGFLAEDTLDFSGVDRNEAEPESKAVILEQLTRSREAIRKYLQGADDAQLGTMWTLANDGEAALTLPRGAVVRGFLINHHIHHRGQLTVYLRMLEVPVPSVYGPSADEAPAFLSGG